MILNQLEIYGEHTKGIIYEDSDEGITLKYDPNTQFITFWDDEIKYDQMVELCCKRATIRIRNQLILWSSSIWEEKEGEGATLL